jgi:hypothetical protein
VGRAGLVQGREEEDSTSVTMPYAPRRSHDRFSADLLARIIFVPVLAGLGVLFFFLLPAALVLPALSLLMVLVGFALAGGLYLAGRRMNEEPTAAWNIAAALVFLGFAAGILTDGEEALAVLERLEADFSRLAAR